QAGNYIARIVASIPSGGQYTFTYKLTPSAPQPCRAAAFDFANPQPGLLSSASCRSEIGLADLYSVTLTAAGTLDFSLSPVSALSAIVAIRDTKDNLIVLSRDAQDLGVARLSADLPDRAYTVLAASGYRPGLSP